MRTKKPAALMKPQSITEEDGIRMPAKPLCWETFFKCQRSPVLRSEMLTALRAGTPFEYERAPVAALLDLVLLTTAARTYHDAEIVDDYEALLRRTDEVWRTPDYSTRMMDSIHGNSANFIIMGSREFTCAEESYIPAMVGWYLSKDAPNYFVSELTEKDVKKRRAA